MKWIVSSASIACLFVVLPALAQSGEARPPQGSRPSSGAQVGEVEPVTSLAEEERQRAQSGSQPSRTPDRATGAALDRQMGEPDVLLDVPNLSVDEISLDVENLQVHLALDARLANLLKLTAGADASIEKVGLTIKGVQAQAYLVVRLDNVARILDRTLTTIDRNPEILERLLETVDTTVGTVGGVADTALQPGGVVSQTVGTVGQTLDNVTRPGGVLSETVNSLGQTVQRTVDQTGNIVQSTLDSAGKVVNTETVAKLADLEVLEETKNQLGRTVRRVRDTSGAVIEYTVGAGGRITDLRVVEPTRDGAQPPRRR